MFGVIKLESISMLATTKKEVFKTDSERDEEVSSSTSFAIENFVRNFFTLRTIGANLVII